MSNSYKYQFLYSKVPMLTMMQGDITIGASGAVSSAVGRELFAVTKLATGIYTIQLTQNYNGMIGAHFEIESPVTGSNVSDGSFVSGTLYSITAVGTTNWYAIGLNAGLTPAVGQNFVATGVGGAGTGTAKAVGVSGLMSIEVAPNQSTMLSSSIGGQGAIVTIQTLNTSDALANPASGTNIHYNIFFRDSSSLY